MEVNRASAKERDTVLESEFFKAFDLVSVVDLVVPIVGILIPYLGIINRDFGCGSRKLKSCGIRPPFVRDGGVHGELLIVT